MNQFINSQKKYQHMLLSGLLLISISLVNSGCKKHTEGTMRCLYIVEHVKALVTGQKKESVKKMYYADTYSLSIDSSQPYVILIDLEKEKVFLIDDRNKRFYVVTLSQFRKMAKDSPAYMTNEDVIVETTSEVKTIDGHNCKKYLVKMTKLGMDSSLWISGKINAPMDLFYSFSQKSNISNEMTKLLSIMRQSGGYTMLSETSSATLSNFYTRILTVGIKEILVDKNFFAVPKGYRKESSSGL